MRNQWSLILKFSSSKDSEQLLKEGQEEKNKRLPKHLPWKSMPHQFFLSTLKTQSPGVKQEERRPKEQLCSLSRTVSRSSETDPSTVWGFALYDNWQSSETDSCQETGTVRKSQSRASLIWKHLARLIPTQLGGSLFPQGEYEGTLRKYLLRDTYPLPSTALKSPAEIPTES